MVHCPSDEESLAAYEQGVNNLVRDEHTLALYTFSGPVAQRASKVTVI